MGRTLKRVPLDFEYEIGKVWKGYKNPYDIACEYCDGGWSEEFLHIKHKIYNTSYTPKRKLKEFVKKMEHLQRGESFGGKSVYAKIIDTAKELGIEDGWHRCDVCEGSGIRPDMEEKYENWSRMEPEAGDGYQLWETTTEGSPKSPVFEKLEELCKWCENNVSVFGTQMATKEEWYRMLSNDCVEININGNIFL